MHHGYKIKEGVKLIIKISDIIPDEIGLNRVYFTIDGGVLQSLLMNHSDLTNVNSVENAIKNSLKGKQYIGHSFEL